MNSHPILCFPGGSDGNESARSKGPGLDPWIGKIPWRRALATHSSILALRIPWREKPGILESQTRLSNIFTFTFPHPYILHKKFTNNINQTCHSDGSKRKGLQILVSYLFVFSFPFWILFLTGLLKFWWFSKLSPWSYSNPDLYAFSG